MTSEIYGFIHKVAQHEFEYSNKFCIRWYICHIRWCSLYHHCKRHIKVTTNLALATHRHILFGSGGTESRASIVVWDNPLDHKASQKALDKGFNCWPRVTMLVPFCHCFNTSSSFQQVAPAAAPQAFETCD